MAKFRVRPGDIAAAQKENRVVQLKMAGLTFEQIAKAVGYENRGASYKAYQRAMSKLTADTLDQSARMRQLQLQRCDAIIRSIWELAHGRPARKETDARGRVRDIPAVPPDYKAVDRLIELQKLQIQLLGLSAPKGVSAPTQTPEEMAADIKAALGDIDATVPKPNGHDIEEQEEID